MRRTFLGTDDSTSSDEEGVRARRRSNPLVLLTDDSDSKSDSCTPKAGEIFYLLLSSNAADVISVCYIVVQ